ncbi:immunoglobulin-like domain-containing protein [Paenibacillus sp. PAMC21692]|uniref:immunoglobulin-like domain-containing protein n=1 Tax=Paenibacillus sp. PAMC21692 TaxID=2762320 RepID=UPI00164E8E00|nr:immunoglobulin-like domain-containing protein [Paenibacillus sp. PAMC21692]QNK60264.1 discoidin domain-containing protein [Paenibacillus sp. PAMC21692]
MGIKSRRIYLAYLLIASLIVSLLPTAQIAQAAEGERVNVALGKSVTSSSSYENSGEGWTRSNLVDGAKSGPRLPGAMENGFTTLPTQTQASESNPAWVQIDLGMAYPIGEIALWPRNDNGTVNIGAGFPIDFKLKISADNATWTTVAEETGFEQPTTVTPHTATVPMLEARYVRLEATKLRSDDRGALTLQFREMEVFRASLNISDEEAVDNDYGRLFPGGLNELYASLPLPAMGLYESNITWQSTEPSVISPAGRVQRPAAGGPDVPVTLTATVHKGSVQREKVFDVIVKAHRERIESGEDQFQIGIFWPPTWEHTNLEQYQAIRDAHVDVVQNVLGSGLDTEEKNMKILELAEKTDLKVNVADPRIRGTDADIAQVVATYKDYWGAGGYYIRDEPGMGELAREAHIYREVLKHDDQKNPYVNLLPNIYGGTYEKDYVRAWMEAVGKDDAGQSNLRYLMYDHYPFRTNSFDNSYYDTMNLYRQVGLDYGVKTGAYLQSIGFGSSAQSLNNRRPNSRELAFSAYSYLAYGFKYVTWFTYWTPSERSEFFTNAIIDPSGNKTDLYEPFQRINGQMSQLGKTLIKLDAHEVYHSGATMPTGSTKSVPSDFLLRPVQSNDELIVSYMKHKETGQSYVMVVNKAFGSTQSQTFTLQADDRVLSVQEISRETGTLAATNFDAATGRMTTSLPPGEGRLYALQGDFPSYTGPQTPTVLPAPAEPQHPDLNLALNKSVDVSSDIGNWGWAKNYAVDGVRGVTDSSNGWSSYPSKTAPTSPAWFKVDLGAAYPVKRIVLWPRNDGASAGFGIPEQIEVKTSMDGVVWNSAWIRSGIARPTAGQTVELVLPAAEKAKYVRVETSSMRPDNNAEYAFQFSELEIYQGEAASLLEASADATNLLVGQTTQIQAGLWQEDGSLLPVPQPDLTTSDDQVIEIEEMTLKALTPGTATIHVSSGAESKDIVIEVRALPEPWVYDFAGAASGEIIPDQQGLTLGVAAKGIAAGSNDYAFVYQPVSGHQQQLSVDIPEHAIPANGQSGRAGLLIRAAGDTDTAAHVSLAISPEGRMELQARDLNGQMLSAVQGNYAPLPVSLKLVQNGETFTGFYGHNGQWYPIAGKEQQSRIVLSGVSPAGWEAGLVSYSGVANRRNHVEFADLQLIANNQAHAAAAALEVDGLSAIVANITLPTAGPLGSTVSWSSGNEEYLLGSGEVLKRPSAGTGNVLIPLVATVQVGQDAAERTFTAVLMADRPESAERQNLARSRMVTVSSEYAQDGWGKEKAVDGLTVGQAGALGFTTLPTPNAAGTGSIMVDLGSLFTVDQVVLWPRNDSGLNKGVGFPVDFAISVSTDKANWTTVHDKQSFTNPASGSAQKFDVGPLQDVRYVRVEGNKLHQDNNGSYAMQFAEIEVFGQAPASQDDDYDPVFRYLNYREDFEMSELGDKWTVEESAESSIVNDGYRLKNGMAYYSGRSFDDFKYTTEVTIDSGSDTSLIVRAQDANNFYQTNVSTDGWNNGQIRLYKNVNGDYTQIGEPVAFTAQAGVKMNMTLVADGDLLRFSVDDGDGPLTVTAKDATFSSGYVGIKAFNSDIKAEYVKVYEKEALPDRDKENIQIGVFWPPTKDFVNEEQYDYLQQAHVDLILNVNSGDLLDIETNKEMLRLAAARDMRVQVSDTRFAPSTAGFTDKLVQEIVRDYDGRPGLYGYYVKDEPTDAEMTDFAAVYQKFLKYDPDAVPYVSLAGGANANLWVSTVGADQLKYLNYADYPFYGPSDYRAVYFPVLDNFRKVGEANDVPVSRFLQSIGWNVGQPNEYRKPTENDMRLDAFATLAYDYKAMHWFTWWTPTGRSESFFEAIIDAEGKKTEAYGWIQKINAEVKAIGRTLINLKAKEIYHNGTIPANASRVPADFIWKPTKSTDDVLLTLFADERNGRSYMMVVNKSLTNSGSFTFDIHADVSNVLEVSKQSGLEVAANYDAAAGQLTTELLPGEGRLFAFPADYKMYTPFFVDLEEAGANGELIRASWKSPEDPAGNGVDSYRVVIAQDKELQHVVHEEVITGMGYVFPKETLKHYHVQVLAQLPNGRELASQSGVLPIVARESKNRVYTEDFADGTTTGWSNPEGAMSVENGELKLAAPSGNGIAYYNETLTDFIYEGTATIKSGSDTSMLFRMQDANNFYQTNISTHHTAAMISLYKNVNGNFVKIGTELPYQVTMNQSVKQTLTVKGNQITFTLDDGKQVRTVTATDNTFSQGRVGVRVFHSTATFDNITIDVMPKGEAEAQLAANALVLTAIDALKNDLILPTTGLHDSGIVWASSNPAIVGHDGTLISRPSVEEGDATIVLTATVTKEEGSTSKSFAVTVKAAEDVPTNPDEQAVAEALAALTLGDTSAVKASLSLPTSGLHDTQITWESSNPAYMTANGSLLQRPVVGAADLTLTLTATIAKGTESGTKTFQVKIKAQTSSGGPGDGSGNVWINPDIALVKQAKDALDLGNTSSVIADLNLPSVGLNGTTIAWKSSNTDYIGDNGRLIARPAAGEADVTVSMTATISKGIVKETKTFTIIVKAEEPLPGEEGEEEQPPLPSNLSDIAGHWAENLIKKAVAQGIVLGFEDDTFRPNAIVTRAELSVMLSRALNLNVTESGEGTLFADDAKIPLWARGSIRALVELGLLQGYSDGRFGAEDGASRVQVANLIVRALQLKVDPNAQPEFADANQIPQWGRAHVAVGVQAGLFQGKGNNTFDPLAQTTRAEAVKFIMTMLEHSGNDTEVE